MSRPICQTKVVLLLFFISSFGLFTSIEGYCRPGESCWPSKAEIDSLLANLSKSDSGCLPTIPVFVSADQRGNLIANPWYKDQVNAIKF
jgi:hypothetical protein